MSLKTAFAAVLKVMRAARGLSQKNLAEVSSRTYVSKLERGQSSPTLEMITALSAPLGLSPLTLITLTIGTESGQSIRSLVGRVEDELRQLANAGVLIELNIPIEGGSMKNRSSRPAIKLSAPDMPQTEFCFSD
ncbi:helix-turn-helix transcriptional regulator [Pseudomonas sp. CBSPBW29]|uniref:helix-turn-helix domain-containing protein n=1 Tax=Pseudomonas sp. CBS TaxID=2971912 RepID=UPI0021AD284E|nr:helix-turn-helix transcriptional regulator [Pseudomonas sp. CBS]WEL43654.1 helix-turn-helix transcriptional regulator [Pseudomonas sp. CBSPBW29]WEL64722.1 helix-turn-helix transcriptional regulator [Pseudomonas sp. CBSPGW29]WEL68189.1 helix-turn-helix transcriptional regulator [Pseudomonas sp. CBSPCGW29]WEL75209.1 helix-turn-helix transcriptional regulator [Pseudomonas sp. CBSPAW29]WEL80547.1 helix-turn-helix transcriptional regulator [Pseudomonas sp. CBSPCAW29]WEL89059.1 helix-turn-helix 